jgi:hypothetical protein
MPLEDMEEQGLAKIPDLGVAQLKFQLQNLNYTNPTAKQQVFPFLLFKFNWSILEGLLGSFGAFICAFSWRFLKVLPSVLLLLDFCWITVKQ